MRNMAGRQIAKPPLFLVGPYAPRGTVAVVIGALTRNRKRDALAGTLRPRDLLNARSIEQVPSSLRAHHPAARPRIGLHGAPVSFDARLHLLNAFSGSAGCQTAERTLHHRKPAQCCEHLTGSDKFDFHSRHSHPTHVFRKRHSPVHISGPCGSPFTEN